jgi:hypothetical protein
MTRLSDRRTLFTGLFWLLLFSSPLTGQTETATIFGVVKDAAENSIPSSSVDLANLQTGIHWSTVSSEEGRYRFDFVPPGEYAVRAAAPGYQESEIQVSLHVGSVLKADLTLVRLYEMEGVVIEAERVRETEVSAGVSTVIDEEEIERLPYRRREYQNLAILAPGVRRGSVSGVRVFDLDILSVGGRDGSEVHFTVDGTDNSDFSTGVPLFEFPQEAVEEFQVSVHGAGPEKGGSAGGFVNLLTKSGTNTWVGSAFTYFRNDAMAAQDYFMRREGISKPGLSGTQFGASLGGPIVKDRTHIFAAYEGTRGEDEFFTVNTGGAFPEEDRAEARPLGEDLFLLKLTHAVSEGKDLTLRYNQQNSFLERLDAGGEVTLESSRWEDVDKYMLEGKYDWRLGPHLATRFTGFTAWTRRFSEAVNPDSPVLQFPSAYLGSNPFAPYEHKTWRTGVNAHFSLTGLGKGSRHTLTAGSGYERVNTTFMSARFMNGFFSYTVNDPDTLANLFSITLGDSACDLARNVFSLYVEDDWLATDRLTLSLGMRYDAETGIVTDYSGAPAVRYIRENYDALRDTLSSSFPELGLNEGYRSLTPDLDNVAPRLHATYDLMGKGKVLLKGGYGIYFDSIYDLVVRAVVLQSSERPLLGYTLRPDFGPGDIPDMSGYYDPSGRGSDLVFLSPCLETPYTHQSSVGIAFPLTGKISVEADYVNSIGRNELKQRNLNFSANGQRFLTGDYGNIIVIESIGRSRYDALLLQCAANVTASLRMHLAYTLARTEGSQDGFDTRPQDNLDPLADVEFGPTIHDATHTLTADFLTDFLWGFEINSLLLVESPRPYTIFTGLDENRDGLRNDMPEGVQRNSERGDWTFQWDARFSKKFPHRWGTSELLVDVLNITNTDNFGNFYFNTLTSESFGQPTKVFALPRRVQIGLRHVF